MNKSERDKLREHAEMPTRDMISLSHRQVLELLNQLDRYEETLKFYAEKSNWVSRSGKIGICPIDTEDRETFAPEFPWAGGKRARKALGEEKE